MKEEYRKLILSMLEKINSERFLRQVWTILKIHMEKRGDAA